MTFIDEVRAEVERWLEKQELPSSDEVMAQFWADSLGGASAAEMAEAVLPVVFAMIGPCSKERAVDAAAFLCSGVLIGARAARAAA
jgi:hypothetical protein